jgi:hypothetical protein
MNEIVTSRSINKEFLPILSHYAPQIFPAVFLRNIDQVENFLVETPPHQLKLLVSELKVFLSSATAVQGFEQSSEAIAYSDKQLVNWLNSTGVQVNSTNIKQDFLKLIVILSRLAIENDSNFQGSFDHNRMADTILSIRIIKSANTDKLYPILDIRRSLRGVLFNRLGELEVRLHKSDAMQICHALEIPKFNNCYLEGLLQALYRLGVLKPQDMQCDYKKQIQEQEKALSSISRTIAQETLIDNLFNGHAVYGVIGIFNGEEI